MQGLTSDARNLCVYNVDRVPVLARDTIAQGCWCVTEVAT